MTWNRGKTGNPGGESYAERRVREMESLVMPTLHTAQPMDLEATGPLTVARVADYLGIGRSRVHQLDHVLQPTRCACGVRLYSAAIVITYARQRGLDREVLSRARSEWMHELRRRMRQ
jgi:hypothetical protein